MALLLLLLRWLLPAATAAAVAQAQTQPLASRTDLAALYSLRASLGLRALDWPLKADPCARWAGVDCLAGRVVGVTVAGLRRTRLGATAPAPPRVALEGLRNLTALARFNASGFALPGEIPPWFGAGLPAPLAVLDLTSAAVNGTLPPDLGASGNLTAVHLSGNRLTGSVPAPLLSVAGLRVLDLSRNNLTGALPNVSISVSRGAGDAANASVFNVSGNSLYGVTADAIGALRRRFQVVDVSSNYLDGAWNGSDTAVLATTNCFYGVPGQRSRVDCEDFYRKQGVKLVDAPAPSPVPLPEPTPSPSSETNKKQRISKNVLIGVLVTAGTLMALFFIALLLCLVKRTSRGTRGGRGVEPNEEGTRSSRRRDSSVNPVMSLPPAVSPGVDDGPKNAPAPAISGEFTYEQLVLATGGFGDDKLIKHGHSGDIYHGVLENGSHVIVKKVGAKGANKHASELDFYTKYSHERIVPLLAHLSNDDEEFLAYKYMPKGDLTNALHKKPVDTTDGLPSLDWITRLKIATGVAEAMCFLHDECSPPLVHRDIQSSSVLLDDKYEVRLGSMSDICIQQNDQTVQYYCRAWILHLFGSVLFPDGTGDTASWMWIPCLTDWDQAGQYSWGSAVLAFLYRQLCEACRRSSASASLGGCAYLLQLWMWSRLPVARPVMLAPRDWFPVHNARLQPTWAYLWDQVTVPHARMERAYKEYTDELDRLMASSVTWDPYADEAALPFVVSNICDSDSDLYRVRCPLICFYAVEYHLPHRVARQFGARQRSPPSPISTSVDLHKLDRKKNRKIFDWAHHHRDFIDMWNLFDGNVDTNNEAHTNIDYRRYQAWYHQATRPRLRLQWTQDDYADIESSEDEDTAYDTSTRTGRQVGAGPILDRVGNSLKMSVQEIERFRPRVRDDETRSFLDRLARRLRRTAARCGCRTGTTEDVFVPSAPRGGVGSSSHPPTGSRDHGTEEDDDEDDDDDDEDEDEDQGHEEIGPSQLDDAPWTQPTQPVGTRRRRPPDPYTPGTHALGHKGKGKSRRQ